MGIFERDGYRCHYCRLPVRTDVDQNHPRRATIDHKQPRSKGGGHRPDNLVTACRRCNNEKADIPYDMYLWFRHMILRGHSRAELLDAIAEVERESELVHA